MDGDGVFMFDRAHAIKRRTAESRGWWRLTDGEEGGVAQLAGVDMRAGAVG